MLNQLVSYTHVGTLSCRESNHPTSLEVIGGVACIHVCYLNVYYNIHISEDICSMIISSSYI